jgi:hypothetical protein
MKLVNGNPSLPSLMRTLPKEQLLTFLQENSPTEPRTASSERSLELEYALHHKLVKLIYRDVTTRYLRGDTEFHGGEITKIVDLFKLTPAGSQFIVDHKEAKLWRE